MCVYRFHCLWIHPVLETCVHCMVLAPSAAPNGKVLCCLVAQNSSSQSSLFEQRVPASVQINADEISDLGMHFFVEEGARLSED